MEPASRAGGVATLARRRALLRQVRKVDEALERWQAIEANRTLPRERQRRLRSPAFTPQSLHDLRQTLLDELAWLEQVAHRQTNTPMSRRPHRPPAVPSTPTP